MLGAMQEAIAGKRFFLTFYIIETLYLIIFYSKYILYQVLLLHFFCLLCYRFFDDGNDSKIFYVRKNNIESFEVRRKNIFDILMAS